MNKKSFYYAAIAALALSTAACSNEMDAPVPGNDGLVTFTAQLPSELASRAEFNTGTTANTLSYAVYEAGTDKVIYASTQADAPQGVYKADNMTFTLSLNLVKGQTYDLIFWADKGDTQVYSFSPEDKTVSISYENLEGNDDSRDAFFNVDRNFTVTGAIKKNIELHRPFAQLNIGTNDIDVAKRAGIELGTTTVTVAGAYNTLNLLSGIASYKADAADETEDVPTLTVTYPAHAINEGYTFPVDGTPAYTHLSMNYVLTGSVILGDKVTTAQKENVNLDIAFADVNGKEINSFKLSSVPVQRNYRTNIFGSLLTSQVDYTILVEPGFWEEPGHPFEVVDVWNGTDVDTPVFDETGTATIASAAQLVGLAEMMTASGNFSKKTVVLDTDVDMGGFVFQMGDNTHGFSGVFDGNGHTIKNFKTTEDNKLQANYGTALFPTLYGTVKNLTISGVQIGNNANGGYTYGNMIGAVAGYFYGYMENVVVDNCTIIGFGKVGGLAGMFEGSDPNGNRIVNCKVTNCTIQGKYNVAEGVGLSHSELAMPGCEFTNNTLVPEQGTKWIEVGPAIGVYEGSKGPKPASIISGTYVDMGAYYSTGAKYYNSRCFDDYAIMVNGVKKYTDGVAINTLGESFPELPSDLAPVSETYSELYKSGMEYYIATANGLEQLNAQWSDFYHSNLYGTTVNVMLDIDATGKTWKSFFATPDSNSLPGFTFNGNGHTISNLAIESGIFNGLARGHDTDAPALFKDITFENCTSTGNFHVGIVGGQVYGEIALENVKVLNCTVSGNCNVGGMLGSTTVEGSLAKATFTDCEVSGCTLKAEGREGCDPTGASAFVGRALNMGGFESTITLNNCTASGNTFDNPNGLVGGGLWASVTYDNGWKDATVHN